ncbi:MAG: serine/threonine protein kinase [Amphiamblys sp. WSBS2006]|nr:MAG: serine/threonine protein kinase [Amphiamblys sp. WSBS2006]
MERNSTAQLLEPERSKKQLGPTKGVRKPSNKKRFCHKTRLLAQEQPLQPRLLHRTTASCLPEQKETACVFLNKEILEEYTPITLLHGAGGKIVLKSRAEKTGSLVCVECSEKENTRHWTFAEGHGYIPREVYVGAALCHPNIAHVLDFLVDNKNVYTIREHCKYSLAEWLRKDDSEASVERIFAQVLSAVKHAYSIDIIHNNIWEENIKVDELGNAKLVNWENTSFRDTAIATDVIYLSGCCLTPPEYLKQERVSLQTAEVWMLGMLAHWMLYGSYPDKNGMHLCGEGRLVSLIPRMLKEDPGERISHEELYAVFCKLV